MWRHSPRTAMPQTLKLSRVVAVGRDTLSGVADYRIYFRVIPLDPGIERPEISEEY